jgi:Lrp/AsnC family transcriptional regulator for asnA, asnC and gidA
MLDETSWKIMHELSQDGRITNAELGLKLGINAATVAKKVNSMLKEGILTIKAVPNRPKIGYPFAAVIGLDVNQAKLEHVCSQIIDNPNVNVVVTCFGRFDALIVVNFSDRAMLRSYIREELKRMKGVTHIETFLCLETTSESTKQQRGTSKNELTTVIDEIDQKIIKELMQNGRSKHADLAKKLGVDTSTVSRRISFLIKEDLMRIVGNPNPSKLGYSANAFIMLSADIAKVDEICNQLYKYPEVHMVMQLMNGFEILFGVHFPNLDMLFEFIQSKIATIDGVINTETLVRGKFFYYSNEAISLPPIWHSIGSKPASIESNTGTSPL